MHSYHYPLLGVFEVAAVTTKDVNKLRNIGVTTSVLKVEKKQNGNFPLCMHSKGGGQEGAKGELEN